MTPTHSLAPHGSRRGFCELAFVIRAGRGGTLSPPAVQLGIERLPEIKSAFEDNSTSRSLMSLQSRQD